MQVTRGRIQTAIKCVVYGPEGVGKSTFASQAPNMIFSDIEGSTKQLDVARFPTPTSWAMQMEQARFVRDQGQGVCFTYALDTVDFLERLCSASVCATNQKNGIEDFGYGSGYTYVYEEFGKLLNLLDEVIGRGVNVILNAHACLRKFEQPDETGGYDRWELKLQGKTGKNVSAMVKEWADMVLFANYKTVVINVDNQGAAKGKNKVQGGKRVMYTTHNPCWDAKNRYGLPDELPFEFSHVAHCFLNGSALAAPAPAYGTMPEIVAPLAPPAPPLYAPPAPPVLPSTPLTPPAPVVLPAPPAVAPPVAPVAPVVLPVPPVAPAPVPPVAPAPVAPVAPAPVAPVQPVPSPNAGIPKELLHLMTERNIAVEEIQDVVSAKGFYPKSTPIANYDPGFVAGWILTVWPQIVEMIESNPHRLPF